MRILPPQLDASAFRVAVPTLVIWGERDEALLTANLDGLEDVVADLRVVRIPDGSHWVVHEQPDGGRRADSQVRCPARRRP